MTTHNAIDLAQFLADEGIELPHGAESIELSIAVDSVVTLTYRRGDVIEKELVTVDMLAALGRALIGWAKELERTRG